MNRFEKELLDYINESFRSEIDQNIVTIKVNTDDIGQSIVAQETDPGEFAIEPAISCESWMVEIVKTTTELKKVRIVIESPDADMMNKIDDYRLILKIMTERAKDILNNPPFKQYVSQGVIRAAFEEGNHVEFIPKDKLREMR